MSFDPATYCEGTFADESLDAGLCLAFSTIDEMTTGLNTFFLLFAAAFVFMMQAGFAMLCAGSIRQKNVKNIMLKNILDACGGAIGFWSVGYAFAYGGASPDTKSFIGNQGFFLSGMDTAADLIGWFFQFAFAATAATIVAGTVAERCKMEAYLCYSFFLTGFVYPVIVHSVWSTSGFISAFNDDKLFGCGMHDFAGSGVVHLTGGTTAIIAAVILGPRIGRFYDRDGNAILEPKAFPPHSVALQVLGTFILWVGWYGFNPGSTLFINTSTAADVTSLAAVNTTIGAAAGCLSAMFTDMIMYRHKTGEIAYDITMVMNGALTGLVAVTAGCSVMAPWGAYVTGIVAGWVYIFYSHLLVKLKIDDAVDAIPVHFGGGSWGCIALGLFAEPMATGKAFGEHGHYGWFYEWGQGSGDGNLLAAQVVGVLWIIGWVSFTMVPFLLLVNLLGWFRVDTIEEEVGLDISHHKGAAYDLTGPDEKTMEKFDLHRSQHKLEMVKEVPKDVPQDPVKDNTSEAGYNEFVASVGV